MTEVAAVVVNWNGADALPGCLEALVAQDDPLVEIVVVDNASSDCSVAVVERVARSQRDAGATPVRLLRNEENRGYAGGANDGIAATSAPLLLVLNPDARPDSGYVAAARRALDADERVGAVQGRLLRPARGGRAPVVDTTGHVAHRTRIFANRGEGTPNGPRWDEPGRVFGVSGALALYRRAMLDDVALPGHGRHGAEVFDEDLFAYFEDVDLDWRAAMRGWVSVYVPDAVAEHERGGAGPRRTADVERLNFANRLLVLAKCDTPAALARALPGVAATTLAKAVWLGLRSPGALLRAVATVVRVLPRMRAKRALVHGRAVVPSAVVVAVWFAPFDYRAWVRVWWQRTREAAG